MSIEVVKEQIKLFLKRNTPEVIAIKGGWGVGKTYSWNQYLCDFKTEMSYDKYSYVSLFGMNSIKDLKQAIFENTIKKNIIGKSADIDTFKDNTFELSQKITRKFWGVFKSIPLTKSFSPMFDSLSFLSLTQTVICLDDLERKGSKLEVGEVLGLISQLKEQKNCKVVLLLNDSEGDIEDYKKYREKVIDLEVDFSPTPNECVDIAFKGGDWLTLMLKEQSIKLNIRNIRVLKQIQKLAKDALAIISDVKVDIDEKVKLQVIKSLVLFSWSFYCSKGNCGIPTLDYIQKPILLSLDSGSNNEKSDKEKAWDDLLRDYEYFSTDKLNLVLHQGVSAGYFNKDSLIDSILDKNDEIIVSKSGQSLTDAWGLYHESLEDNQADVISGFYSSVEDSAKHIDVINLNEVVKLLRKLEEQHKASEIIDLYIEKRRETPKVFNTDPLENPRLRGLDSEIERKFKLAYSNAFVEESPDKIIARLVRNERHKSSDLVSLRKLSVDDMYDLIRNTTKTPFLLVIDAFVKIGEVDYQHNNDLTISQNLKLTIQKLTTTSKINKLRLSSFSDEADEINNHVPESARS